MRPEARPTPQTVARLHALSNRVLSLEEWQAVLALPVSEAEQEELRALIRWFRRRYPTPAVRLAYARRAYRRWTSAQQR